VIAPAELADDTPAIVSIFAATIVPFDNDAGDDVSVSAFDAEIAPVDDIPVVPMTA
jgi:hypothetical protein